MLLTIPPKDPALRLALSANPAAISEALDYDRVLRGPSTSAVFDDFLATALAAARLVSEDSHCSTHQAFSSMLAAGRSREH